MQLEKVTRTVSEYGKVAVLMGGRSAERDISLKSGQAVLDALQAKGVDAHKVDAKDNVIGKLSQNNYNRVFNMLHGRGGEDGEIQGLLQVLGLPYTGSGIWASALCMNKLRTKQIWQTLGLPTAAYVVIEEEADLAKVKDEIGFPVIIKPVNEGSSIGMAKVTDEKELRTAWLAANAYDDVVLAEKWITGKEYTVAILDGKALPLVCLQTPHEFYDYDAKYQADTTSYLCPCGLNDAKENEFRELALKAFEKVGASGWGRVDIMMDEQEQPYLIEINTLPGMTDHSLFPMATQAAGLDFSETVLAILESSMGDGSS